MSDRRHRRFWRVAIALVGCLAAALSLAAAETGAAAVDSAWAKAFKANDLEGVMACYAPDAIAWFPTEAEHQGTDAIRASYKAFFDANTVTNVSITNPHQATVGGRSVSWGNYSFTAKPKAGGESITATGRFTDIAEKRGSRWVYVVDHASADPAPAPPAKQ
jgi:uncharacterized protein (TIGR02246 family)